MDSTHPKNTVKLSNGAYMPLVGMGTFQLMDKDALVNAVVNLGYRHIDTAWFYQNESLIGEALTQIYSQSKITRDDLFITTKIWPS